MTIDYRPGDYIEIHQLPSLTSGYIKVGSIVLDYMPSIPIGPAAIIPHIYNELNATKYRLQGNNAVYLHVAKKTVNSPDIGVFEYKQLLHALHVNNKYVLLLPFIENKTFAINALALATALSSTHTL